MTRLDPCCTPWLALQETLMQVQATAFGDAQGAGVLAYLDDAYLVGPLAWATSAYRQLAAAYPAIGLRMRNSKGGIYSPRPLPPAQLTARHDASGGAVSSHHRPTGVRVLGQLPIDGGYV